MGWRMYVCLLTVICTLQNQWFRISGSVCHWVDSNTKHIKKIRYCVGSRFLFLDNYDDLQCRHLIPALNARSARASYTTARPISTQFPGHGCMYDLTTERSFGSQATLCLAYF